MRLICPNCAAQYEIDEDLIPAEGRDVQCSDCGHTWFETPGASLEREENMAKTADIAETPAMPDLADEAPADPVAQAPEPPVEQTEQPEDQPDDADLEANLRRALSDAGDDTGDQSDSAAERAARTGLTGGVAQILREEAEHEKTMRARDADGLETQPDLGLHDSTGDRRGRLPDIEEINSSLRSEDDWDDTVDSSRSGGFWRGFVTIVLIAFIAALLYLLARPLADLIPALSSILNGYVSLIDSLRLWLADIVHSVRG